LRSGKKEMWHRPLPCWVRSHGRPPGNKKEDCCVSKGRSHGVSCFFWPRVLPFSCRVPLSHLPVIHPLLVLYQRTIWHSATASNNGDPAQHLKVQLIIYSKQFLLRWWILICDMIIIPFHSQPPKYMQFPVIFSYLSWLVYNI
jgi:hypothetical protein